jgi:hypothetical protein
MCSKALVTMALFAALTGSGHRSSLAGERDPSTPDSGKPAAAELLRPKITISRETTYFTGPLRPDGYVDYLAATNEYCSKGVTPENNAAGPLIQAFGPGEIDKDLREGFFNGRQGAPNLPRRR